MCGIYGFVATTARPACQVMEGLRRLEYRGYDSWGIALLPDSTPSGETPEKLVVVKQAGKISRTSGGDFPQLTQDCHVAIGHTRWATHGAPSEVNAHPHLSQNGRFAVAHNGIVENFYELRQSLTDAGFTFVSETDTEVISHLIQSEVDAQGEFTKGFASALQRLRGAFGLAVLDAEQPGRLFAVRLGSPLVIGVGEDAHYIASDANALVVHTHKVLYLKEGEWAEISADRVETFDFANTATLHAPELLPFEAFAVEKGTFAHFMLKEIFEQPRVLTDALRGRLLHGEASIHLGGLEQFRGKFCPRRIKILACGSSWHAALVGRHYFEELALIPTDVEYASEFRYRNAIVEPETLVIAISQSGETADTLAGLRESVRRGAVPFGIVNVVGSTIARECDQGVYLHAGPELGVAATKSFLNQIVVLLMMALFFGRKRTMSLRQGLEIITALESLPDLVERTLGLNDSIRDLSERFWERSNFLYIGRALEYPIALEGALKLKEVSYIHAEGLPAAELKHGPIALITPQMPTVVVATQQFILDKVASNVAEIRARGGETIAVVSEENQRFRTIADHCIEVPRASDWISPILATVPLQLLAYHLAVRRGCDVDQPRNLAKSVTVE